MFSIDQNCHSLWDVLPKLQALSRRGVRVRHFVEDIDAAFTALGSEVNRGELRIARERYHHSGGADWGAALFYSEFLGRLPADLRDWEPLTGMKTAALARQLGRSVEDLYEEFSPGDNWQLIGPSYVGDRDHHRVIGDLSVAETGEFLREIVRKAKANALAAFPSDGSRSRLLAWFAREEQLLESLLGRHADASLGELYRGWLGAYLDESVSIEATSGLFALSGGPAGAAVLRPFLNDYDLTAGLYNEALAATGSKLRPLRTRQGELPFFAVLTRQGHLARTGLFRRGGELVIGDMAFRCSPGGRLPVEAMTAAGVRCLAGKAVILVIQACLRPGGAPLALPHRGSLYMPAARDLAGRLARRGMLPGGLHPVVRVRFRLLDRIRALETPIRLPEHLAQCFGTAELPARELGEHWASRSEEAAGRLAAMAEPDGRSRLQQRLFPDVHTRIAELEGRKRALARSDPKGPEVRELWRRIKSLQVDLLDRTLRQIDRDVQVSQIDYWDSRGALWPWSVALGGEAFYEELIAGAEVSFEPLLPQAGQPQA